MTSGEAKQMNDEGLKAYYEKLVDRQEQARSDIRDLEEVQKAFEDIGWKVKTYVKELAGLTEQGEWAAESKVDEVGHMIEDLLEMAHKVHDYAEKEIEAVAPIYEERMGA